MTLITDRTEADVLLGNEKGHYGFRDLNRVETAAAELDRLFPVLGFSERLVTKTDWGLPGDFDAQSWPCKRQMDRYLGNIIRIRKLFAITISLPTTMTKLTAVRANNIEKVLKQAKLRADAAIGAFHYSGETIAGEEIL